MARHTTSPSSHSEIIAQITRLLEAATAFVPRDRGEAVMRKWLASRDIQAFSAAQRLCRIANALTLSADLVLSQPSVSGATSFDRLAKSPAGAGAASAAMAALQRARFRLLRLEGNALTAQDRLDGLVLRIAGHTLPPLPGPLDVFVRVAVIADGICCLAGPMTPLDAAAASVAASHPAGRAAGAAANARWAEAVYGHVMRHGTLEVPGLNCPDAPTPNDLFEDADHPVISVARDWADLGGAAADAALLARTRQLADLPGILDGFAAMAIAQDAGQATLAAAFDRVVLVLMETVLRREICGAGSLTLDAVAQAISSHVAQGKMPANAMARFAALRQRLIFAGSGRTTGDAELARLVQRIQGLRAKTIAQGCTEQEALAAAAKVAELLDRYGLSLGELDFQAQPCDGIAVQTGRRRMGPIDNCIPAIAAFFDCRVWAEQAQGQPLRYVFFGLRADVAAAQYLYELVERAFDTETDAFRAGAIYAGMAGERRSATHSFQIGLASGITAKLRTLLSARATRANSGRDLVAAKAAIVDDEVAKLGLDFRRRERTVGRQVLSDAFAAGHQAGERFEVVAGIRQAA